MSEFNDFCKEFIGSITQNIDLPAFVSLTSKEAKFLFGNNECYDNIDTLNYVYVDVS